MNDAAFWYYRFGRNPLDQIAAGTVPGVAIGLMVGKNSAVGTTATETVWDQGGNYTYLSADTTLYVSSTSASDTAVSIVVPGLDDTYTEVTRTATLNGQTQVALNGDLFRNKDLIVVSSTTPVGDIYLAESDTLTAGVPDTASKIKGKIPLSGIDIGTEYASDNSSHNGFVTVPAKKTLFGLRALITTGKDENISIGGRVKLGSATAPWLNRAEVPIYQSLFNFPFDIRSPLPAMSELQFRAIAGSANSLAQFQVQYLLIDDGALE